MRVLAFDAGAERLGWASLSREENRACYHISGILALHRGSAKFQEYRMELTRELINSIPALIKLTDPDEVVTETVPAVGGGNFVAATQSYLANTAITVVHTVAISMGIDVYQIGATTVQSRIAIRPPRASKRKATKVQVRNGVFQLLPELEDRKSEWTKVFDEPDAIAVGLVHMGFKNNK